MSESLRVEDQTSEDWDGDDICFGPGRLGHQMISIKVGSLAVPFVERCEICGFIEPSALTAHADNWVKTVIPRRAQRIAVAIETDPFRFVQPSTGELPLREILAQAFAALADDVARKAAYQQASDGKRETAILRATIGEVERLIEAKEGH